MPQRILARTEVDADAGTVAVIVSEQALRRSVGRALAHQIAAASARLAAAADPAAARRLAAAHAGRTAELRYVERRRAAAGLRLAAVDDVLDLPQLRHAVEATAPALAEVAASWMPGSEFHGEAVERPRPLPVIHELMSLFTDDPVELRRATGLDHVLLEGQLWWITEEGRRFRVEWTVVPGDDVGPATVVAGVSRRPTAASRIDRARQTVTIRVSDRARLPYLEQDAQRDPLWVFDVLRALSHELTEAAAVFDGAPTGANALTPGRAAAGRQVSPWELTGHDRGRLAEVGVLLRAARDPALRDRAGHELAVLLDSMLGLPVALDPETGAVAVTGRSDQDPVLADLVTARDVGERAVVLNRVLRQIPDEAMGIAIARHLVQVAAARAGATATPIGASWVVLTVDGRHVAINLRAPQTPSRGAGPPAPRLRAPRPPEGWTFDRILRLTVPPAGPDDLRVVRSANRAVAAAVAALRGRPIGPGVLARERLTAAPTDDDLTSADVGTTAELLPAVRFWASSRRLERVVAARDVRRRLAAAQLGFDQPGGELRYRALQAAGLVPDDVQAMLDDLRGARLADWRRRLRNRAVARIGSLGDPGGAGRGGSGHGGRSHRHAHGRRWCPGGRPPGRCSRPASRAAWSRSPPAGGRTRRAPSGT